MPFTPVAIDFLRALELNNDRDWFQPRKEEYAQVVRAPMVELVNTLNRERGMDEYATDPARAIYRIYRDTRFSKDKKPYKTHIGALFPHRRLGKDGGAALYVHLSPTEFLVAGGLYMCPPEMLVPVRAHIAEQHQRLTSILKSRKVREFFGALQGSKLTRPPKGWSADHPSIDYLRHKDFLLEVSLPAETALGASAAKEAGARFRAMLPFVDFLNAPLVASRKRASLDPLLGA